MLDYLFYCSICGADFKKMKNIETFSHWYDIKNISFCFDCRHSINLCMSFTAVRMPLEDIPLIISTLNGGQVLTILKYRLEHGIESPASYKDYPILDPEGKKFKEICIFINQILGTIMIFGKVKS